MRDDYWTLGFPRLTQDTSDDSYPDHTKDDTMTTDDLADQITALLTGWGLSRERVVSRREAQTMASALVKLWPDTPPTSPLPDLSRWHPVPAEADIPPNTMYVHVHEDGDWGGGLSGDEGHVAANRSRRRTYYTEQPMPAPDPDPDAKWVAELVNPRVNPLSEADARALIAAIREARR